MINFSKYFILFSVLLFSSCMKHEEYVKHEDSVSDIMVTISKRDSSTDNHNIIKVHGDIGKYAMYFKDTDAQIGLVSSRYRSGTERVFAYHTPPKTSTKSTSMINRERDIQINGRDLFSPMAQNQKGSVTSMFGQDVTFDFSRGSVATKGEHNPTASMYVPTILRISTPQMISETQKTPLCYYDLFTVRWNADRKNSNGVMIIIRWRGSVLFGNDSPSQVCHTVCVTDNGQAVLDESMFEGIPDTAFCEMYLVRGNIENIDVDQIEYQLLAETFDMINFVLIRNIKTTRK